MSYELGIVDIFHPITHGLDENSSKGIENHFLCYLTFPYYEFEEERYNDLEEDLANLVEQRQKKIDSMVNENKQHPTIRNYFQIMNKGYNIEIVQNFDYNGEETIAIIKTCWLKIFQRKWKNFYKKRKEFIKKAKNIHNLHYRQIHGRFPFPYV
jgi:hypothetical protein